MTSALPETRILNEISRKQRARSRSQVLPPSSLLPNGAKPTSPSSPTPAKKITRATRARSSSDPLKPWQPVHNIQSEKGTPFNSHCVRKTKQRLPIPSYAGEPLFQTGSAPPRSDDPVKTPPVEPQVTPSTSTSTRESETENQSIGDSESTSESSGNNRLIQGEIKQNNKTSSAGDSTRTFELPPVPQLMRRESEQEMLAKMDELLNQTSKPEQVRWNAYKMKNNMTKFKDIGRRLLEAENQTD